MHWAIYTFCLIVILIILENLRKRSPTLPPGPQSYIPLIGGLARCGQEPQKYLLSLKKKWGNFFSYDFGGFRGVVINDYKLLKEALVLLEFNGRKNARSFRLWCEGEKELNGMLFCGTEGKAWSANRRFTLKVLREFGFGTKSMEKLVEVEVDELLTTFKTLEGTPFLLDNHFNGAVLNSLWSIIAGERNGQNDPKYLDLYKRITRSVHWVLITLMYPPIFKLADWGIPLLGRGVQGYIDDIRTTRSFVRERMEEHKKTFQDGVPRDFIDKFLEEIRRETDPTSTFYGEEGERNLITVMHDVFLAGSETTSTSLKWIFLLMVKYPDVQCKLFEEIQTVVGDSRTPNLSDRPSMPYTNALILELLRFTSLIPFSFHEVSRDIVFQGYLIPKGTQAGINYYAAHYDATYWGDPESFRPERFLSKDNELIRHEAFMPFGFGKKACIGEALARDELFLFITSLFQKFRVTHDPSKAPPGPIRSLVGTVNTPIPFPIVLQERN